MNNADNTERRLQEIEERLERFEAPEAPQGLLESIQAEIPAELGTDETSGTGEGTERPQWRRLAASLAVVAVGGMLGYRLLNEGPAPGDTVLPSGGPSAARRVTEIGEGSGGELTGSPQASIEEPRTGETATGAEVEVAPLSPSRDDGSGGANEIDEVESRIGRLLVGVSDTEGAAIPGTTVTLSGNGPPEVAVTDARGMAEFRDLPSGEYGLRAELDGFGTVENPRIEVGQAESDARVVLSTAVEETLMVTSEASTLDPERIAVGTSISNVDLEGIPTARDPWAVLNRTPGALVDRINVAGHASGQQSEFREQAASNGVAESENVQTDDLRAEQDALKEELKNLPSVEEVVVTAEAPLLQSQLIPKPKRASPPTAADASSEGIALRSVEQNRLRALGYLGGVPSTGGTAEPNDQAYGDMFFQAYGTNPFIDTEDDAQSTFGIDVDTASYTMARSYLERGNLPPADAIRVEEFINYFDYNDPAPRNKDFAVVAEGAPSPFASTARTYLLRFALKGREIAESQRKPAVLTFVIDVSGSMKRENRLGLVKRALRLLVDQLDSRDAVGLVIYGSHGSVLLQPTSDHRQVLAAIDRLQPGGSTNAEEGLVLGYRTARQHFRQGAINRVILCSDGVANVGATGPDSILARIAAEADQGIELTTVGFGMGNYNDVLMEQLADKGDGNYAYVDNLDAARRVFVENLSGTLQTIAGDAKIQVEFDQQVVQSYRLLGYENRDIADRDFRNDAVDAGEIGAGHQVTALYEVKLRSDSTRRGNPNLATLRLRYESKRSGRVVEDAVNLRQSDLAGSWGRASRGLQLAATVAEFAEVLKGSYWAKDSDLMALAARARGLGRVGSWDSELAELTALIERAARLRGAPTSVWEDGIER